MMDVEVTTELIGALFRQVIGMIILSSVVVDGLKKTIKTVKKMPKGAKLHSYVGLGLMYSFGLISGFAIQSPMLSGLFSRLFVGIIVGVVGVSLYDIALKSIMGLVPGITKKLLGK
jgi:hypothetical protein